MKKEDATARGHRQVLAVGPPEYACRPMKRRRAISEGTDSVGLVRREIPANERSCLGGCAGNDQPETIANDSRRKICRRPRKQQNRDKCLRDSTTSPNKAKPVLIFSDRAVRLCPEKQGPCSYVRTSWYFVQPLVILVIADIPVIGFGCFLVVIADWLLICSTL